MEAIEVKNGNGEIIDRIVRVPIERRAYTDVRYKGKKYQLFRRPSFYRLPAFIVVK